MTDPRDELIRVYEEALDNHQCSYEPWNDYKCLQCEALSQGAEIKKLFNKENSNVDQ